MKRFINWCAIVCAVFFTFGCQSAQIAFPAGNAKTTFDKLDVKDRGGFAIFSGKFTIGNTAIDWTQSALSSSGGSKSTHLFGPDTISPTIKKQDFTVKSSNAAVSPFSGKMHAEAEMEIETTKQTKNISTTSTLILKNTLKGTFETNGSSFELSLSEKDGTKKGDFKGKGISFDIESSNSIEGSSFGLYNTTTGYYIYENAKLIAVVDVMNNGTVYIGKEINKDGLSAVTILSAALLKYKDPAK
jgi:hypothetical protein